MTIEPQALNEVCEIATAAGRHLMTFFRSDLNPRAKTETSFVTEADESTEILVREALQRAFPGEAVLGEEFGLEHEPTGAWWVIDPIDGTSNFVSGIPIFCVSLARVERGHTVLAVTHDPNTGETFRAARGHGAYLGSERLAPDQGEPGRLTVLALRHSFVRRQPDLLRLVPTDKFRSLGSACLEMAYIAAGRLHGMVARRINLWDVAAGALLIEEAGGVVHTRGGRPLFPLAYSPEEFVKQEIPLVAGTGPVVSLLEQLVKLD